MKLLYRYLASPEPALQFTVARALFGGFWVQILDHLSESQHNIFDRQEPFVQPLDEGRVKLFRFLTLPCGLRRGDPEALGGWFSAVPLKRIASREKVAAAVAVVNFKRVRLCGPAVTLELLEGCKLRARAEAALDCLDRPTCQVGLRCLKEQPKRVIQCVGYLEKFLLLLLHRVVDTVRRVLTNTTLDPSRIPMRRIHRTTLLEARSRCGLVVKSMRNRGREPLRSASRLLGFAINLINWDPGHKVVAGPSCGPLCIQDPRSLAPCSFLGRHSDPHLGAFGFLCLAVPFPEGRGGYVCRGRV
jgi:hypothetical protein